MKCNAEDWVQYGIHADTANGWSIADVSGVPGVSFNPKLNNGYGGLTGAPTKAGTFVATVTVEKVTKKKAGKKIKVTTESKDATCLVVVQPLPEWLVGTYNGWTDGVGTAYFCGNVHWEGKMIDLTGSATMCITRIGDDEIGLPYLREVRTPEEWRAEPGYIVFAKFVKDGYAFEVAWHFSGLTNPVLNGIRGVLLQ